MGQGTRQQRVANAMRDVLTELISREVKDPRVHGAGLISVSQVEINRDLSVAYVYVSFMGGAGDERAEERALAALAAAAGFLRGPVGRRMRLQRAPELRFMRDARASFGQRMREILLDDEQRGPAAEPGEGAAEQAQPGDAPAGAESAPGEHPDEQPGAGEPGGPEPVASGQKRDEPGS
jgi:ribosome-binding factor A